MREKIILLLILTIFVIHAISMNFTQDDAYISYRYVKNFLNGHGLVFNPGERVEGYTNFLWIILLSLFAKLGLDMIIASKILGVASGCVTLFLLYQISVLFFQKKNRSTGLRQSWFFALFPSLLLASNSGFAWVYELMGEQYYFLGDYPQSEKYLKKAIQMDDHCVDAHFFLRKIYQERKMDLEAKREKEKILKYNPGFFGPEMQ
jgi:tetratricopeptide (TPR) repeat protein